MSFSIGTELAAAHLAATIVFADAPLASSRIEFYSATGELLAQVPLAKPCGTVTSGVLTLAASGLATVIKTGVPALGAWYRGDNTLVASGSVGDAASTGDFKISGGVTATGNTSPTIYLGGAVALGVVTFT